MGKAAEVFEVRLLADVPGELCDLAVPLDAGDGDLRLRGAVPLVCRGLAGQLDDWRRGPDV